MSYVNKYRQYLHRGRYEEDESPEVRPSVAGKAIAYGALAVGAIAGGYFLFKGGALRGITHRLIKELAEYRGNVADDALRGVRKTSLRTGADNILGNNSVSPQGSVLTQAKKGMQKTLAEAKNIKENLKKDIVDEVQQGMAERTARSEIVDMPTLHERKLLQIRQARARLDALKTPMKPGISQDVQKEFFGDLLKKHTVTHTQQAELLRTTGFRYVTLGDLRDKDYLTHPDLIDEFKQFATGKGIDEENFWRRIADPNLLIDEAGNFADLRPVNDHIRSFIKSMANDFHIPFIRINPLKMFFADELVDDTMPSYAIFNTEWIAPFVTGNAEATMEPLMFSDGFVKRILDTSDGTGKLGDILSAKGFLTPSMGGSLSRYARKMSGIQTRKFYEPRDSASIFHKARHWLGKTLDIGFQDEPIEAFNPMEPSSYFSEIARVIDQHFPAHGGWMSTGRSLDKTFGHDNPYAFIPSHRKFDMDDIGGHLSQFTAGRGNIKDVTATSFVGYALFERLNAALNLAGLGLSIANTGSGLQIFGKLLTHRALPVVGAIAAYQYLDYEAENFGMDIEGAAANVATSTAVGLAAMRDATGLTDIGKRLEHILYGSDQITEIPGLGFLDWSKTAEETREQFESGEVAVRRGRWWNLGNTSFTGGRIEYFAPNVFRRAESDYEFTSTLHGSKEEFWANAPIPTPRHPFAPIRHFITNPYRYEKMHYYSRPYLQTGGIAAIEELPIVGPILGATVGQILKPTKRMHLDEWEKLESSQRQLSHYGDVRIVYGGEATGSVGAHSGNMSANYADITTGTGYFGGGTQGQTITTEQFGEHGAPTRPPSTIGRAVRGITEMAGFYGFTLETATMSSFDESKYIADSRAISSYRRQFWDAQIGGMGGDVNEIGRRFIGKREKWDRRFNPIRNQMPDWLPGAEYFTDFQTGDPYAKILRGEMRLPGEAYETLYDVDINRVEVDSAVLGGTPEQITQHILAGNARIDRNMRHDILNIWRRYGIAKTTEREVHDRDLQIYGVLDAIVDNQKFISYYDQHGQIRPSRLKSELDSAEQAAVMIQEVNQDQFNTKQVFQENLEQLNFHLYAAGLSRGYVVYKNIEDESAQHRIFAMDFDPQLLKESVGKLNQARGKLNTMLAEGSIVRGDLYDHVTRLRILGDVAPWSDQYKRQNEIISNLSLTPEQRKEVATIRQQVSQRKDPMRIYPYRFRGSDIQRRVVTVERVLDNNTFMVKEFDNPIRLAGIHVPSGKDDEKAQEARGIIEGIVRPGARIQIGMDPNPETQIENDTYRTIQAVVYADHVGNLNRELIRRGLAREREKDFRPAAVHARFTSEEILLGKAWETFAHGDSPFHTKFLQVRSGLESYKRRDVYGKNWQEWSSPVSSFIVPTFQSFMAGNPALSVVGATVLGSMFGRTKFGKIIGGAFAGGAVIAGQIFRHGYEAVEGEKWIPGRRKKEREIEEYMDILKYVKYNRLYSKYADAALKTENVDVRNIIAQNEIENKKRLNRKENLETIKRDAVTDPDNLGGTLVNSINERLKRKGLARIIGNNLEETISGINAEIRMMQSPIHTRFNTILAQKAYQFYKTAESTVYAFDPGDNLQEALSSLPRKERKYMPYFMKAPAHEREEILRLVPASTRRILQSVWGRPVDEKPDLVGYFSDRELPSEAWRGWRESSSLENVKIKLVKREAMDASEFDIWPDQMQQAQTDPVRTPNMHQNESPSSIRERLYNIMTGAGFSEVNIFVERNDTGNMDFDVDIVDAREEEIQMLINQNRRKLFTG